MNIFALVALPLSLAAPAGHAGQARAASARPPLAAAGPARAEAVIGRDGQDTARRCSNENPNIEYRDCVNASTRDSNAKIRLG